MKNPRKKFTKAILAMKYNDLMFIASDFQDMTSPDSGRRRPTSAEEFASMLYDWAAAQDYDE